MEMDQSFSECDISLSPQQILERLQTLRQLQLLQRGKLHKHRLQYQEVSGNTSSITEIVSSFSNSTSYNTFQSQLQSSTCKSTENTPRLDKKVVQKVEERDLVEGVSLLNLSQESECIINSPTLSRTSAPSEDTPKKGTYQSVVNESIDLKNHNVKPITLDEMPILSPKKDFESLIQEKLRSDNYKPNSKNKTEFDLLPSTNKKPFLKKGEGMSRFGIQKCDLVIQNTKSLPWKNRNNKNNAVKSPVKLKKTKPNKSKPKFDVQILITEPKSPLTIDNDVKLTKAPITKKNLTDKCDTLNDKNVSNNSQTSNLNQSSIHKNVENTLHYPTGKHPLLGNKGKTWAAVLTKEQDDFLRQLKQSEYYKNFASPAKSVVSDISCDENIRMRQEKEHAEQHLFNLIEKKVTHESFHLENSFFKKFLKRDNIECSGESTPLVMQRCLSKNPDLMNIIPNVKVKSTEFSQNESQWCPSDYTDCCSETCSSVSSCCSCKTVETITNVSKNHCAKRNNNKIHETKTSNLIAKEVETQENKEQLDSVTENANMKADIAEMNAKLVTTSELLKERLTELEDEIETFRKENANLNKLREEVDLERQKFYEDKTKFEQKLNEEKILSEYYLAEEKDKLNKQKQMYERYVREIRGRLNRKDKDEVLNLKKEINDLKEEIRIKDAKSTSTIARLRNHIKIIEKDSKELQDKVEKLKKENKRIQHSNDITRRLTNIKYLEEINKKLTHISSKDTKSEIVLDRDIKYKAHEIERQSRSRSKTQPMAKSNVRPRAKSVPNLNVTSRYAKYFSQRDVLSSLEHNDAVSVDHSDSCASANESVENDDAMLNYDGSDSMANNIIDDENNLEKIYLETFRSLSPKSNRSSLRNLNSDTGNGVYVDNMAGFFFTQSNLDSNSKSSNKRSLSPFNSSGALRSESPVSIVSNKSTKHKSTNVQHSHENHSDCDNSHHTKSLVNSMNSSQNDRSPTVILQDQYRDKLATISPEPSVSKTSLMKTSLNPTEIRKPDGSRELRFPNGNVKQISADGKYSKFIYYNGDVKENFYNEGRIKYFYAETKTYHTTHADGLEVLEFPDGQVEKRYKDGSSEIRLPNGSIRYHDPKNSHVREEWRFPDGTALTVAASGEQRIVFSNGQVEVHAKDHKRREFPDGTVKLVYNDGTSETRYASGRVRIKDKHGNLIMDSSSG